MIVAVYGNATQTFNLVKVVAECLDNRFYDLEGNLCAVIQRIREDEDIIRRFGDCRAECVIYRIAILGEGYGHLLISCCHHGVGKPLVIYIDCIINGFINGEFYGHFIACLIRYTNTILSVCRDRIARNILTERFAIFEQLCCEVFLGVEYLYILIYGLTVVCTVGLNFGSCGVNDEAISCLVAIVVLEGKRINAILDKLIAAFILDYSTVFGECYDCFIIPLEGYLIVGVTVILNAVKSSNGVLLNIVDLCGYCIDTCAEFIRNSYLVDAGRAEGIRQSVEGNDSSVIVLLNDYPSFTAVGGLVNFESLKVAFIVYALNNRDVELLLFLVIVNLDLGCVARNHKVEHLGFACMVNGHNGVGAAFG